MKKTKNRGFIVNSCRSIKLVFQIQPGMLLVYTLFTIVYTTLWVLQVLSLQKFFDAVTVVGAGQMDIRNIMFSLLTMGLVYLIYHFMDGLDNCYPEIIDLRVSKYLNHLIFKQISRINNVEFEDTKRLDYINQSVNGSGKLIWVTLSLIDIVFYYAAYFLFMGWYLFTLKPVLALSILVVFIPSFLSQLLCIPMFNRLEEKSAPLRRTSEYYKSCLTHKEYFKETRLLGATEFFKSLYTTELKKLNHISFAVQFKKNIINLLLNIVTVAGYGIIIYILFISVMRREISIGAFAAVLASIGSLYRFMNKLITERIGWATENIGLVENFLNFIEEEIDDKKKFDHCNDADIQINEVSFKYPMTDKNVLQNINLTIHKNETIAIVGENGSGKSTLCRLIMGLYSPTEGEVRYGDKLTTQLNFNNISAVFQGYRQYQMTVRDNLTISQTSKKFDDAVLKDICKSAGVQLESRTYQDGLDTILGRDFGGKDLSGGQWQRVAIARGLFRQSNVIVLDEPTAAIDPLEETRLYNDFLKISHGKTAVIVTHRLGAAKLAGRIIVLKDGKIVQEGNHNELVEIEGAYKQMYETQKMWYSKNSLVHYDLYT